MREPPDSSPDSSSDSPPPPQPAATVACLDTRAGDFQVLLVRRRQTLVFHGGAWVFPGGRVDPTDGADLGASTAHEDAARMAAVREAAEEAALTLDPATLVPLAHWTTPPQRSRRFSTWFYLCRPPHPEGVRVDGQEIVDHRWLRPQRALDLHTRGDLELPPPTFVTLMWLSRQPSPEAALAAASRGPVEHFVPRPCRVAGGEVSLYHGDAGYPTRDPERPGARHRLWRIHDRYRYERTAKAQRAPR